MSLFGVRNNYVMEDGQGPMIVDSPDRRRLMQQILAPRAPGPWAPGMAPAAPIQGGGAGPAAIHPGAQSAQPGSGQEAGQPSGGGFWQMFDVLTGAGGASQAGGAGQQSSSVDTSQLPFGKRLEQWMGGGGAEGIGNYLDAMHDISTYRGPVVGGNSPAAGRPIVNPGALLMSRLMTHGGGY